MFTSGFVLSFSPFHSVGTLGPPSLCCKSRKTVKYLKVNSHTTIIGSFIEAYLLHPTARIRRFNASICVISTAAPFPASNVCKIRPL
jgi:hypothetical protein